MRTVESSAKWSHSESMRLPCAFDNSSWGLHGKGLITCVSIKDGFDLCWNPTWNSIDFNIFHHVEQVMCVYWMLSGGQLAFVEHVLAKNDTAVLLRT